MMRSLFSGVSGLRTHQLKMDVIGDNIANVNTVGFKRSAATFKDVFYQTLRGGTANTDGGIGGTNAQQIGLGVALNSIDVVHTQGAAASTGNGTDLMIQGDGFFRVSPDEGTTVYYTRAGAFHFDDQGFLVNADGMKVLGADDAIQIEEMAEPSTMPQSFSIDSMGVVHYVTSDGEQATATGSPISIAKFANPAGLEKAGSNLYKATYSSGTEEDGTVAVGAPGDADAGLANTSIIPSTLEMSNVDLAQEFTDMIITERGFQANARTITTSDQMLQELVNLKR